LVAAKLGLKVLVVEKTGSIGGTSAYSGGGCWIPNNHRLADIGATDSREAAVKYLRAVLGSLYEEGRINAYLDSGPDVIRFIERSTELRFMNIGIPDYYPNVEGLAVGRTLMPQVYDGKSLGKYLRQVRDPLPGFKIFRTMQVDPVHIETLKNTFNSPQAFLYTVKRFLSHFYDVITLGKGSRMAMGNALIGAMLRSALDAGLEIWCSSPARRIITEKGRVSGVVVNRNGVDLDVPATFAVVLASGGFGANVELRAAYTPMPDAHISVAPSGNVGDGLTLGQEAGGTLGDSNPDNGTMVPVSELFDKLGNVFCRYPHFGSDRCKPGSIVIDGGGRRFTDESAPYLAFVQAMHRQRVATAFLVADHKFLRKWGMGLALPAPMPFRSLVRAGYLIEASTLDALARKIGVDPIIFQETVTRFNNNAARGIDPDFGRGENVVDLHMGDPTHSPNPNLAPLEVAPFYAVKMHPGDVGTVYGLKTTADAEVLRKDGTIVKGLYAVGLDQNSVMRGTYPGGGCTIGPALTFGYRAARHIASSAGLKLD